MPWIPVTLEGDRVVGGNRYWHLDPTAVSDVDAGFGVALPSPSTNTETTILTGLTGTSPILIKTFVSPLGYPQVSEIPSGVTLRSVTAITEASNQVGRLLYETYLVDADGSNPTLIRSAYTKDFSNQTPEELISSYVSVNAQPTTPDRRLRIDLSGERVSGPTTCNMTVYFNGEENAAWIQSTILVQS